jgi:FkbM family methyltransferase
MKDQNKVVIEIGANIGTDTLRLLQEYPDATIYSFEPTHELLVQYLWPLSLTTQRLKVLPFAVDIENGFKTLNVAGQADWGCSSLYEFSDDIHTKWLDRPDFKKTHEYVVPTITMYDFCNLYNINSIEHVHIDTQGNDFNCLLSFKDYYKNIKTGRCEVIGSTQLYKNTNNTYINVYNWLTEKGFKVPPYNGTELPHEFDLHFNR